MGMLLYLWLQEPCYPLPDPTVLMDIYILVELVERWLTMREVPGSAFIGNIAFFGDKIYPTVTFGGSSGKVYQTFGN